MASPPATSAAELTASEASKEEAASTASMRARTRGAEKKKHQQQHQWTKKKPHQNVKYQALICFLFYQHYHIIKAKANSTDATASFLLRMICVMASLLLGVGTTVTLLHSHTQIYNARNKQSWPMMMMMDFRRQQRVLDDW